MLAFRKAANFAKKSNIMIQEWKYVGIPKHGWTNLNAKSGWIHWRKWKWSVKLERKLNPLSDCKNELSKWYWKIPKNAKYIYHASINKNPSLNNPPGLSREAAQKNRTKYPPWISGAKRQKFSYCKVFPQMWSENVIDSFKENRKQVLYHIDFLHILITLFGDVKIFRKKDLITPLD